MSSFQPRMEYTIEWNCMRCMTQRTDMQHGNDEKVFHNTEVLHGEKNG